MLCRLVRDLTWWSRSLWTIWIHRWVRVKAQCWELMLATSRAPLLCLLLLGSPLSLQVQPGLGLPAMPHWCYLYLPWRSGSVPWHFWCHLFYHQLYNCCHSPYPGEHVSRIHPFRGYDPCQHECGLHPRGCGVCWCECGELYCECGPWLCGYALVMCGCGPHPRACELMFCGCEPLYRDYDHYPRWYGCGWVWPGG